MRVDILTFSKVYNRGANMQAYALKNYLEKRGCDVFFIDLQLPVSEHLNLHGKIWTCLQNCISNRFRCKNGFKYTMRYCGVEDIKQNVPVADVYVVGSDQVWNPDITKAIDPLVYYFSFLPRNAKKVAYAASFGSDVWLYDNLTTQITANLREFKAVSVREDTAAVICRDIFGINAEVVLDPTLLLTKDELMRLINRPISIKSITFSYLLFCGSSTIQDVQTIHKLSGNLQLYGLPVGILSKLHAFYSIEKWLYHIATSNLVVTNSFHCMVMSILLHKNFVVIPPYPGRETRMLSLLNKLNLLERYVASWSEIQNIQDVLLSEIDYNAVDAKLSSLRIDSERFIDDNILN